jgi:hypothetical protein
MDLEFQIAVFDGQMIALADERYQDARVVFTGDRKTDGIGVPLDRQARAVRGISQAAVLMKSFWFGGHAFVARSGAVSLPP